MTTAYPGALDVLTNPASGDVLTGHASQHANVNDAVESIEATLGTNPQGGSASVKARLDALDSTVASIEGVPAGSAVAVTTQTITALGTTNLDANATIVFISGAAAARTLAIPAGSSPGRTVFVFDVNQNFSTFTGITVTPPAGKTINGQSSVFASVAKQALMLTCDSGGNWMALVLTGAST